MNVDIVTDCLNRSEYDHNHHGFDPAAYPSDDGDHGGVDQGDSDLEHPFHDLKKLLSSGIFYYSADFDLTARLQDR